MFDEINSSPNSVIPINVCKYWNFSLNATCHVVDNIVIFNYVAIDHKTFDDFININKVNQASNKQIRLIANFP